mgnify:CR=1 FL=1
MRYVHTYVTTQTPERTRPQKQQARRSKVYMDGHEDRKRVRKKSTGREETEQQTVTQRGVRHTQN